MFKINKEELEIGGKKLTLETGKVARQADGAIIATLGDRRHRIFSEAKGLSARHGLAESVASLLLGAVSGAAVRCDDDHGAERRSAWPLHPDHRLRQCGDRALCDCRRAGHRHGWPGAQLACAGVTAP